jgi:hypothetical protein
VAVSRDLKEEARLYEESAFNRSARICLHTEDMYYRLVPEVGFECDRCDEYGNHLCLPLLMDLLKARTDVRESVHRYISHLQEILE